MDIENLLKELKRAERYCLNDYSRMAGQAATALSTLQAKNEKLRAEVEQERAHRIHAEQHADAFQKDCERLNAELERVKAERDGAVEDLEEIMFKGGHNIDTCHFCTNGQCYGRGGTQVCVPKWRGQKED